ncbi:hypothetical protein niasHT_035443 [Heterodera trifolii]|uniref:Transmembrane protein n=1 Tax=Heterodera trifolii TaxID=157864 RepID=A0ABD2I2B3_9BILA
MQGNSGRTIPRRLRRWLMRVNAHGNFFVRHLLGRELRCTQQSIRNRMRNFDQMLDRADDRPSFVYSPMGSTLGSSTFARMTTASAVSVQQQIQLKQRAEDGKVIMAEKCQKQMNGAGGGAETMAGWESGRERRGRHNSVDEAREVRRNGGGGRESRQFQHICDPFFPADSAFFGRISQTPSAKADAIRDIVSSVRAIHISLMAQEQQRSIRAEWRLLSRMLEKLLKLVFSVFTVTFAVYMLYDEQAAPMISDEWLTAQSKH